MKPDFKNITFILTSYSFLIAILYQIGYWNTFEINIFSYLSFNEILLQPIIPLSFLIISFMLYFLLAYIFEGIEFLDDLVSWVQKKVDIKTVLISLIFIAQVALFGSTKFIDISGDLFYRIFSLTIIFQFSISILNKKIIRELFPNKSARFLILILVFVIPSESYWWGHEKAHCIFDGKWSKYAKSDDLRETTIPSGTTLIYLGNAGESLFFANTSSEDVLIKKFDDFTDFRLYSNTDCNCDCPYP